MTFRKTKIKSQTSHIAVCNECYLLHFFIVLHQRESIMKSELLVSFLFFAISSGLHFGDEPEAASRCAAWPPQYWCDTLEVQNLCGVTTQCNAFKVCWFVVYN